MFFIMNPSCDHLSGFLLIFNSIQLTNSATFNKHRDIVMHPNPEKIYQQLFSIVLRIPQCIYWLILAYIGIYLLFSVFSSNNESINWFTLTYPKKKTHDDTVLGQRAHNRAKIGS